MRNFPINLLKTAQTVIGKQAYTIEQWIGSVQNDRGHMIDSYAAPEQREASIQPVQPKEITLSGLDMNQVYIKIFDTSIIEIMTRSKNPPRISFDGYYWEPIPETSNYNLQGGWNKVVCSRKRKI